MALGPIVQGPGRVGGPSVCLGEDGCLHFHVNPGKLPPGWVVGGCGLQGRGLGVLRLGPHSVWEGGPHGFLRDPLRKTDNGISPLV